jgi:hypothetical protein
VVFGTLAGVKQVLAAQGWQINTAFIERVSLTIRQHVAAGGRRVMTLYKGRHTPAPRPLLFHTSAVCRRLMGMATTRHARVSAQKRIS